MRFADFYNTLSPEELTSLESCTHKSLFRSPVPEGLEVTDEDGCHLAILPIGDEDVIHRLLENNEYLTVYTHVKWEPDQAKIDALGEIEEVMREHAYSFVLKSWNNGRPIEESIPLLKALQREGVVRKIETTTMETVLSYKFANSEGEAQ